MSDVSLTALGMTPKLDYLLQYPVTQVLGKKDGSGYAIEFEGGAIIGVEGQDQVIPEIENMQLLTAIFSDTLTRLRFGRVATIKGESVVTDEKWVEVSPTDYFIIDPRFESDAHYPGRMVTEANHEATIREQFNSLAERAAEGPDEQDEGEDTEDAPDPSDALSER